MGRSWGFAVAALLGLGSVGAGSPSPPPIVELLYPPGGSLLDRLCGTDLKVPVSDKDVQAAVALREELQHRWDVEGPTYMKVAISEIGLKFPYHEVQATLTVCLPASTSVPLIIDVKPFLPGAAKPAAPWEFSEVVFHELMHLYTRPVFAGSKLMKKYQQEPPTTRYHLHVMALERMTLLALHRNTDLATLDHEYRTGPDPQYRRAWEIVTDIEGYQPFVNELKALGP